MKEKEMSIKEWQEAYKAGEFEGKDFNTMVKAGWYDWFCKDSSLYNRMKPMARVIVKLMDSKKVNTNKHYIFFKQNCPGVGNLYDSFKICDIKTGKVLFFVAHKESYGYDKDNIIKWKVYSKQNKFKEPVYKTDDSMELVEWFNNCPVIKTKKGGK